jgi:rRNA maturation protein Rpf1
MYITTSRKPSDTTRRLARTIANFIGIYENRGKKTIEDVVTRADELGENRVMIISQSGGNPNSLSFISVDGEWGWLEPEIIFSVKLPLTKIRRLGNQKEYQGDKKYSNLFDFHEPDTDDVVSVKMNDKIISFVYKKLNLELKIKELRKLIIED